MTTSPWLAHISDDQKEQTILAHLQGTAAQAKAFASPFGAEEQAELAGLAHDIGKYTQAFQKRLRGMTIPLPLLRWPVTMVACQMEEARRTARTRPRYGGVSNEKSVGFWNPMRAGGRK